MFFSVLNFAPAEEGGELWALEPRVLRDARVHLMRHVHLVAEPDELLHVVTAVVISAHVHRIAPLQRGEVGGAGDDHVLRVLGLLLRGQQAANDVRQEPEGAQFNRKKVWLEKTLSSSS